MLSKKLKEYIDDIRNTDNFVDFTKDQLLDIGLRHRCLLEGKDWAELTAYLGLSIKPESFRKWVTNQTKSSPIVEEASAEAEETNFNAFEKLYSEKTKVRDAWNAYRASIREEARIESFYKELTEAIKTLPEIPFCSQYAEKSERNYPVDIASDYKEGVLLLSDLHIGVKCSNFYNQYNSEVAKNRLEILAEDTVKYCKINGVEKLNVLNLGDAIHGLIHNNARLQQEFDVVQQIKVASELIANLLAFLQSEIPEVTYRSVIDNHSRLNSNKEDSVDSENLSKLIDFYLETRLKNTRIRFMHDNIDEGLGLFTLVNGKKFSFAHGHQDSPNFSLQNICGATQSFVDYMALGHTHSNKLKEFQGMSLFINGSVCGTEQYALSKRLFNKASQRLLIFDETDNVVDIKINLQPDLYMNVKKFEDWKL